MVSIPEEPEELYANAKARESVEVRGGGGGSRACAAASKCESDNEMDGTAFPAFEQVACMRGHRRHKSTKRESLPKRTMPQVPQGGCWFSSTCFSSKRSFAGVCDSSRFDKTWEHRPLKVAS